MRLSIQVAVLAAFALAGVADAAPRVARGAGAQTLQKASPPRSPAPRSPALLGARSKRLIPETHDYQRVLAPRVNPSGKVKRVFYPMGASDVAQAFAMFTGPRGGPDQLVIADILPFGNRAEVDAFRADGARKDAYFGPALPTRRFNSQRGVRDGIFIDWKQFIEKVKLTGPAILWELREIGATQVKMRHLTPGGRTRKSAVPSRAARFRQGNAAWSAWSTSTPIDELYDPADRDIVEISFRLRGTPRSILYVQQDMMDPTTVPPVLTRFFERGFDAYLEKAELMVASKRGYQAIAARALAGLDRTHGVLVTDDATTSNLAVKLDPRRKAQTLDHKNQIWVGYAGAVITAPFDVKR
jgi:hypothetical protein